MSVEKARGTITEYGQTLLERGDYARYLTGDVTLSLMGTGQEVQGREAVEGMIRYLHEQAFDVHPELRSLICEDGRCALEFMFVGRHTGEFGGVQATGREVSVPYSVIYELEGDKIRALRIYMPMNALLEQIGAAPTLVETSA